jgi:hypothetical protein
MPFRPLPGRSLSRLTTPPAWSDPDQAHTREVVASSHIRKGLLAPRAANGTA